MPIDPPAWVRDTVFYQVFPDRFARSERVPAPGPLEAWGAAPTLYGFKGGNLLGIVEHLDHIAGLGVGALYLTPIFQSASNHRYHTYDYFTVDPLLGGNDALRELLDAAHGRGIRVILDGVFNHTGRGFWPFHHVVEAGRFSPYRSWFHLDDASLDAGQPLDPYPLAHARRGGATSDPGAMPGGGDSRARLGYEAWWGLPALPKLNTDTPAVREYLWSVAEHWLRFGTDGWRLDVPGEIQDPAFWAEFRRRCRAINPEAYLVGEIWDVAPDWVSGDRFDALMNYPLAEAILGFVGGDSIDEGLLRSHHEYAKAERLDGPGFAGKLRELLAAYDPATTAVQLNLMDSHDSPRLTSLVRGDDAALRLAVLLQASLPGAPCIYYGDEIGLPGGLDPDNRRAFPWDESRWDRPLLEFYRAAFALRRAEPLLRSDDVAIVGAEAAWVAIARGPAVGPERLVVVINAGTDPAVVPLGGGAAPEVVALPGLPRVEVARGSGRGLPAVRLPARSGAIVRLRRS